MVVKFLIFYTYNPTGKDVVIPIVAKTENEAWSLFQSIYGSCVDQVIEHKTFINYKP